MINDLSEVTFCVPIFNDYESLQQLLLEIQLEDLQCKFLFVDNGSSDPRVREILNNNASQMIDYLRLEKNAGFGGAIKFAAQHSTTTYFGWMPGNLKIRPKDLNIFLKDIQKSEALFIKAFRSNRDKFGGVKTFILGIIQSLIARCNLFDTGGTPTLLHSSIKNILDNAPNDYVIESYCLYIVRHRRIKIFRPKVPYGKRFFGESHWQKGIRSELSLTKKIIISILKWKINGVK